MISSGEEMEKSLAIFLGFLKAIKLLVTLFIMNVVAFTFLRIITPQLDIQVNLS